MSLRSNCHKHGRNEYTCGLCRDEDLAALTKRAEEAEREMAASTKEADDAVAETEALTKRCEALEWWLRDMLGALDPARDGVHTVGYSEPYIARARAALESTDGGGT